MATIIGTTSMGTGTRYTLTVNDNSIYVPKDSSVVSTNGTAISGNDSNHNAIIVGNVFGAGYGLQLGSDGAADSGIVVQVLAGASVAANQTAVSIGVWVSANSSEVLNEGSITGGYGVLMAGTGAGQSMVVNTGTIAGYVYAVRHSNSYTETLVVKNYGSIIGLGTNVASFSSSDSTVTTDIVLNRGLMSGKVEMGAGADQLDNRGGTIDGDVALGSGDDSFDNSTGTVTGTVSGDAGIDSFIGNAAWAETFDGGADKDTLDFRLLAGATVALDESFDNDGSAMGDSYSGFEVILGSRSGADQLRGNAGNNSLLGGGGDDRLDGAAGNDFLSGGNGIDVLAGGDGNDTFIFATRSGLGDTILDFSSIGAGNNDRFQITASAFGGGLVAGALAASQFQSRADNVAQDPDDRFIFRTTDKTLWFDDDGNGAHTALLVASLQASATMTNLDIVLV